MTKEEAIKYLQQLYPNGGHCWLDEQRIDAINMAVKTLQEEPASKDLEEAAYQFGNCFENHFGLASMSFIKGAQWQKERILNNATEREVKVDVCGYPYIDFTELYDYDKDIPLAKEGDKVKLVIVKDWNG